MKYTYNLRSLPPVGGEVLRNLDAAADRLATRLAGLDSSRLALTEMGRTALAECQHDISGCLKKYSHLLAWALYPVAPHHDLTLIDYGGGFGLMACLAKEAGIPRVAYNDIYLPWCVEARVIAEALGCAADAYVCGDIDSVACFLKSKPSTNVALVSINVIEHIYKLPSFLRACARLSEGEVVLVLSTSANPLNPLVRTRHHRQHLKWEFQDRIKPAEEGRDSWRAYYTLRREIIEKCSSSMKSADLDRLTSATRGLIKGEIEECVTEFQKTGQITAIPEHPTNTCDPFTGNWEERLLDVPDVCRDLAKLGFGVRVGGGYYSGRAKSPLVRQAKKASAAVLNHAISLLGSKGAYLAPCFMFHASRPARTAPNLDAEVATV